MKKSNPSIFYGMSVSLFVLLSVLLSSCNNEEDLSIAQPQSNNLVKVIEGFNEEFEYQEYDSLESESNARGWGYYNVFCRPTFNTLLTALEYTGLAEAVESQETTIFGPTDRAFAKLGLNSQNITSVPKEELTNILTYHVLLGKVYKKDVQSGPITMLNGEQIRAKKYYYWLFLKGAENKYYSQVIYPDVSAFNGVFHVINRVLLPPKKDLGNIVQTLIDKEFKTLVDLATTAGLGDALANGGPFTVFAPNEAAFEKLLSSLSEEEINALLANDAELLRKVLLHHVVKGSVLSGDLSSGEVETLNGDNITVDVHQLALTSSSGNTVHLVKEGLDCIASNGVIHEIDMVLIPEEVAAALRKNLVETLVDKGFKTLVDLATTAGLGDALANGGPFTVFAPNEAALEKLLSSLSEEEINALLANDAELLRKVLLHHVVKGSVLSGDLSSGEVETLNGDNITVDVHQLALTSSSGNTVHLVKEGLDCIASNGVIHEIDMVLIPEEVAAALRKNLVETLVDKGFKTLVELATTAGLGDALANGGPFTVFAPNEEAFKNLLDGLSDEQVVKLLDNNAALLQKVLLHHVVDGTVLSSDLRNGPVKTLLGDNVYINLRHLRIKSSSGNAANLVVSGLDCVSSNGVIHEISRVLIPKKVLKELVGEEGDDNDGDDDEMGDRR